MPSFVLSWVIGSGTNCDGGKKRDPKKDDVIDVLGKLQSSSGSMTLAIVGGPDIGPQNLHVESDGGYSVIQLGEDDGEDYNVRSYTNEFPPNEEIIILGNYWDPKMVCQDVSIVREIVIQFFENGDVPKSLLS